MPSYQSAHTGAQIDTAVSSYQTQQQVQSLINTAIAQAKLIMYPVGSFYISESSTDPSTFIGGTWVQVKDTFILAAGDTYTAGATGGEAEHTLTTNEMPIHDGHIDGMARPDVSLVTNGNPTTAYYLNGGSYTVTGKANYGFVVNHSNEAYPATLNAGGGLAHNNMPPYLVAYVWKRVA